MLRFLILILFSILLIKCGRSKEAKKADDEICINYFKSLNVGISLKHSDKWKVYNYKKSDDFAVGLTYYDTLNWNRRYDAQIDILTRVNRGLDSSQVMRAHEIYYKHLINKVNNSIEFELIQDTIAIIDNQKWKKIEYFAKEPDSISTRNIEYLFCKNRRVIMISIYVQDGPIEHIDDEIECILNSIKIMDNKSNKNI